MSSIAVNGWFPQTQDNHPGPRWGSLSEQSGYQRESQDSSQDHRVTPVSTNPTRCAETSFQKQLCGGNARSGMGYGTILQEKL